jgi:Hg(II)-responsive transcriptional regulator
MTAKNVSPAIKANDELTIGQLAKAAQVGIETIRYYQRLKLLPTPQPVRNAFRYYPADTVLRIRFIKRAQGLGFSLDEVAALLRLNDGIDRRQIRQLANTRLTSIREKIDALTRIESILAGLVDECEHAGHVGHANCCPIIAAFSGLSDI